MKAQQVEPDRDDPSNALGDVIAGAIDAMMPLLRMYVGPVAQIVEEREEDSDELRGRLLLLALHKFIVEAGNLPPPTASYEPHKGAFSLDSSGRAPALDLQHVLAALRALALWAAAGPAPAAAAPSAPADPARAPSLLAAPASTAAAPVMSARAMRMSAQASSYARGAAHASSYARGAATSPASQRPAPGAAASVRRGSSGCGCRGGSSYGSTYTAASMASRRAVPGARPRRAAGGCDPMPRCDCGGACGGHGCGCAAPPPAPAPEACTPWTPSCEARNRLRACLKDILCDLLRCVEEFICPGGVFATTPVSARREQLERCVADLLCKLLRCFREGLCPPPPQPELPCPGPDVLPCSYAVEDPRCR
ncbi:hypothetical protein [Sorangium sp. So ce394]|uniref:hypothetical protein n=1 Tax=Sorangium sp. So ce394 TaxID=3133310 RepID=UPI003F5B290F